MGSFMKIRPSKSHSRHSRPFGIAGFLLLALLLPLATARAQQAGAKEPNVDKLLTQGDAYYVKGEYKLAIGCYLEASALSQSRVNLSKAYFGLSLCYFYLRDTPSTIKYLKRVMEVDPQKEISPLFYPAPFIQLFKQAQQEAGGTPPGAEDVAAPKPVPAKAEPEKKAGGEAVQQNANPPAEDQKKTPPAAAPAPKPQPERPVFKPEDFGITDEEKGGHWEVGVHYSWWSVNLLKGIFESKLTDELGKSIQDEIVKQSGMIQAGLVKLSYAQSLSFDSSGTNTGLEVRYYSRGRAGTFSLGVGFEKSYMKLMLTGTARQDYLSGSTASIDVNASVAFSPFTTHANFRWEFGANQRLTPFITLGLGFAPLSGTFSYTYSGTYKAGSLQQSLSGSKVQTFDALGQEIDFNFPSTLVVFQLDFGLKAELAKGLFIVGEAGIWDGFMFRGGLAYRF
jgi:tetratricopeptide (TPR) repeat protein